MGWVCHSIYSCTSKKWTFVRWLIYCQSQVWSFNIPFWMNTIFCLSTVCHFFMMFFFWSYNLKLLQRFTESNSRINGNFKPLVPSTPVCSKVTCPVLQTFITHVDKTGTDYCMSLTYNRKWLYLCLNYPNQKEIKEMCKLDMNIIQCCL